MARCIREPYLDLIVHDLFQDALHLGIPAWDVGRGAVQQSIEGSASLHVEEQFCAPVDLEEA